MSKLAKRPFKIPEGVEATLAEGTVALKGKLGSITLAVLPSTKVVLSDKEVKIEMGGTGVVARSNAGTMAALIRNALEGVSVGFTKVLEIEGIGFKASLEGTTLVLNIGYTHPIKFMPPADVKIVVEKGIIRVTGPNRETVGQVAAQIRKFKEPEPYKGKGIHYKGEVIRRKSGKKVAGATGAAAA